MVNLPNGSKVASMKCGTVRLSSSLILQTAYYVPQFWCNLLSITHLCDDTDCVLSFVKSGCIIQDRCSRMLIRLGGRCGRLYYFRGGLGEQANRVVESQDPVVWHRRLGHRSASIVNSLPFVFCSTNSLDQPCDIYYQAKQTRDSFFVK
ncbi:hypothetical protein LIER_39699 [Lithospermum erythrorhizon]|uniref:GAG-pre-integrase domain-containing protein n=1 Tax=Lithospermum erythrorhizon TaxID=34254 RepID=A0AAV3QL54_LITER